MQGLIRIRTKIDDMHRVATIPTSDADGSSKWVTLITGGEHLVAASLAEAGQNHLRSAYALREKLYPAKDWKERAHRDNGFIDDDMCCKD